MIRRPMLSPIPSSSTKRVVAIGDLNGAVDALVQILRGTDLLGRTGRWTGGATHLVQVGDIFNRGDGARQALELLLRIQPEARRAGGDVTVLLGNHEVMTALGNYSYTTLGEFMSFATKAERGSWQRRVRRAFHRIYHDHPEGGPIEPYQPRLSVWMAENVPGRRAIARALGASGRLGRAIRKLPVAVNIDGNVFVHAGLTPSWARLGIAGLNRAASKAWTDEPGFWGDVSRRSILRSPSGPLMTRKLAQAKGPEGEVMIGPLLATLGAQRLVVGHTQTAYVPGGRVGQIHTRFRHRLVLTDVGLRSGQDGPRAALVIEDGIGSEWRPDGSRVLWRDKPRIKTED